MTIDERLQFLLQSSESFHTSCQELHASFQELRATVEKHEERWEVVRRVMLAALQAGLRDDDEAQRS